MRTTLLSLVAMFGVALSGPELAAQQPAPAPKPVVVEPSKQDPKPAPVPAPAKQDPARKEEPKPVKEQEPPKSDKPIPAGTDPADLAAIRSAEAMIEAERKLAEQIKSGKITGLDKIVTFDELAGWAYEDGLKNMPKPVKDLHGKKVLMTGFMLPIDEVQNIKEFLLVQSLWACCYGTPPDINGLVRVVMPKGKTTDYFFDPLKLTGTFKVEATVLDGYCVDIYQLHVDTVEVIR